MKKIFKYDLNYDFVKSRLEADVPAGGELLDVQHQGETLVAWVMLDAECDLNRTKQLSFDVIGTGWEFKYDAYNAYYKTIQDKNGYTWHLFRVRN